MRASLRDREHLIRLAVLFVAGIVVFLIARALLVPEGFGELGHYRSGALVDNASRALVFAGQRACLDCHDDVGTAKAAGKHAGVRCEACHGALAAHAADPQPGSAPRPDPRVLCPVCHEALVGRPQEFPQVTPADHAGETPCSECHRPHAPTPA